MPAKRISQENLRKSLRAKKPLSLNHIPMHKGTVVQIIGPVVDVAFEGGKLPAIFNALKIIRDDKNVVVCEVARHMGSGRVRAVALSSTDGIPPRIALDD